ncbi:hypothetical protein BBJ28_00012253 [Nothophytophthora sp. Chile5]|nr:hypothetical protein BBJ28_00012253 [Nothophytophthora sp. Chile5]
MMQREQILVLAIVVAFASAMQPCVAEASAKGSEAWRPLSQNVPESVVVDVFLADVPDQAHIGVYKLVSEDLYIRQLTDAGVYFSLEYMPPKTSEEMVERWHFRGYDCGHLESGEPKELCSAFVTAELESDSEQKDQLLNDNLTQTPPVITRQSPVTGRKLQFAVPQTVNPPTFTTQTAYYGCSYFGGGSSCILMSMLRNGGDATALKLVLLSDLEGQVARVNQLCEELVSSEDCDVDAVLISGGLVAKRGPHEYEALEAVAAAEGDMMALISRLEMIICRVLYVPDDVRASSSVVTVLDKRIFEKALTSVACRRTGGASRGLNEDTSDSLLLLCTIAYYARDRLVNDGTDPMQDRDLVLVLRDSAVKARLPVLETSFFAGLLPMLHSSSKPEEPHAIEIIGGSGQHPHAQLPLIYPGSLRLGQYTVLELEKDALDGKWGIGACAFLRTQRPRMGGGNHGSAWGNPRNVGSSTNLRELDQLRVLAMYEFNPPLDTQELQAALRACDNQTRDAYHWLKANRHRHRQSSSSTVDVPASAPAAMESGGTPEREREKRRISASAADVNGTPNKKRKDLRFRSTSSGEEKETEEEEKQQDKDATPSTQQNDEVAPSPVDTASAERLLLQTVEDRVAGRQPLRNPEWVSGVWDHLQVPSMLELAMQLNLTADALAVWTKQLEPREAQEQQTQGTALTIDVVARLPSLASLNEHFACTPTDATLKQRDEEVAAKTQEEIQAAEQSAYARAGAAKNLIGCLSMACQTYMDRLVWFGHARDGGHERLAATEQALELLSQKLAALAEQSSREVHEGERALLDAKNMKETRSLQLVEFVRKRHEELVASGETEASASLLSVVEVWKGDDMEVQALWSSRRDSEARVEQCTQALKTANSALTFHQNLTILFRKVRERREEALTRVTKSLEQARTSSEARATLALGKYIPLLTGALFRYYEFHSIQQAKAKEEQLEQEKALAVHNEYFGDSAPIKKSDIEQRIREFLGVTQSSMQMIMEIAADQRKLWEGKQAALPESVCRVLILEFNALLKRLSGPMRDVMRKFVSTMEEAAGSVPVMDPQERDVPVFVASSAPKERVVPAFVASTVPEELNAPVFTTPAFPSDYPEAVTSYRTAISAVVAPNEVVDSASYASQQHDEPMAQYVDASATSEWVDVAPASSDATMSPPVSAQKPQPHHEFAVGAVLYSKIVVGERCTQFVRGVVVSLLGDDEYSVQYDNGDKFPVRGSFLFTREQMEQELAASGTEQDADMEGAEGKSGDGSCAIM